MAIFKPGKPVVTSKPYVVVDAGLATGRYQFSLVVEDEHGNQSKPSSIIVTIQSNLFRTVRFS